MNSLSAIDAKLFEAPSGSILVDSSYNGREDLNQIRSDVDQAMQRGNRNREEGQRYVREASNSLAQTILAQVSFIRAQNDFKDAEFYAHSVCPRVGVNTQYDQHRGQQMRNLATMQSRLVQDGFINMVLKNRWSGISSYFQASFILFRAGLSR